MENRRASNDKLKLSKANEWENGLKQQKRKRIWKKTKQKRKESRCTRNLKNRKQYHRSGNVGEDRWGIKKERKKKQQEKKGREKRGEEEVEEKGGK